MTRQDRLLTFVGDTFQSVWALEVLRLLASTPDADFSEDAMIVALRASKAAIGQSVASLQRVGLVSVSPSGVRFRPDNVELGNLATAAIDLYARRPDLVRRTIVSRTSPGLTAFADAFRLRKD